MAKANIIVHARIEGDSEGRDWIATVLTAVKPLGVTFVRVSAHPEDAQQVWVEGWFEKPDDQGPEPWVPEYDPLSMPHP